VVTGDITQVDLPSCEVSGLTDVQERLKDIPGIGFVYLTKKDIVRHRLVQYIVDAYET
jgi:phosphate starvation-inducible PhoH-like protein